MCQTPKVILLRGAQQYHAQRRLPSCGLDKCGFHRFEHILTEGRNFKTFLKEIYAVHLDSC